MKHTIAGKHGHHYELPRENILDRGGKLKLKWKPICISASEAADSDFMSGQLRLRERLSLKWKVCLWCWSPNPKRGLYRHPGMEKPLALECEKCPAWKYPKKK